MKALKIFFFFFVVINMYRALCTVLSTNVRTSQVSSAVQPQVLAVEHCVVVCHTPLGSLDLLSFRPQSSPVAQCTSSKWFKSGYKIISH